MEKIVYINVLNKSIQDVFCEQEELGGKVDIRHQLNLITRQTIVPRKSKRKKWALGTYSPAGVWLLPQMHWCLAQKQHSWVKEEGLQEQSSVQNSHLEPGEGKYKHSSAQNREGKYLKWIVYETSRTQKTTQNSLGLYSTPKAKLSMVFMPPRKLVAN